MLKKVFSSLLATIIAVSMLPAAAFADTDVSGNLLKNPSFEDVIELDNRMYPTDWIDSGRCWVSVEEENNYHKPVDGKYFVWPKFHNVPDEKYRNIELYQDVDVSLYPAGTSFSLSGSMANCDQYPHDQAVMLLNFYDESGKLLLSNSYAHRNYKWGKHTVNAIKPDGAAILRVILQANRFVGSDNDGYFDNLELRTSNDLKQIILTGNPNAKAGDKIKISVPSGTAASDYKWSSEYDEWATVDQSGTVQF